MQNELIWTIIIIVDHDDVIPPPVLFRNDAVFSPRTLALWPHAYVSTIVDRVAHWEAREAYPPVLAYHRQALRVDDLAVHVWAISRWRWLAQDKPSRLPPKSRPYPGSVQYGRICSWIVH